MRPPCHALRVPTVRDLATRAGYETSQGSSDSLAAGCAVAHVVQSKGVVAENNALFEPCPYTNYRFDGLGTQTWENSKKNPIEQKGVFSTLCR